MRAGRGAARPGEGIYPYETRNGTQYYFKYRKSDGRSATKRGFSSLRAARREREQVMVSAALGEQASTTETFGEFFAPLTALRGEVAQVRRSAGAASAAALSATAQPTRTRIVVDDPAC